MSHLPLHIQLLSISDDFEFLTMLVSLNSYNYTNEQARKAGPILPDKSIGCETR